MGRASRIALLALVLAAAAAPTLSRADHRAFFQTPGFAASADYGDPVTLTARLLEPDHECPAGACPETNKQVDFYVNGEYVGTDVTNSGGYAYLLIPAAQKWHVGSHQIRAQYDRSVPPATVTSTLTITREATRMTARDGYLEARMLDDDNLPVTGKPVTFSLITAAGEYEVCTAYTDFDGVARCVAVTGAGVTPVDAVSYRASYTGSGDYSPSDATALLA